MENLYCELKELFGFKQPKGFSDVDKLIKYFEFCDEMGFAFVADLLADGENWHAASQKLARTEDPPQRNIFVRRKIGCFFEQLAE